jgi:hypothetical protein
LKYANPRNRYQGAFRDIITLDTPETGSPLAWYLDVLASKTEDPSQYPSSLKAVVGMSPYPSSSSLIWATACGSDHQTTFRKCLESMGFRGVLGKMPLAAPNADLSQGAVASLIPGDRHLVNLPDPNIPNATWYAIASNYQAAGSGVSSVLEGFINKFIAALYPTPINLANQPPSDEYMMLNSMPNGVAVCNSVGSGILPNDIIVPVCSQTYHAIHGQTFTFPGLAHAPVRVLGPVLQMLGQGSNANVTDSDQVNSLIAYWLEGQSGRSPVGANREAKSDEVETDSAKSETSGLSESVGVFTADTRLTATVPDHPVELAQPVQIQLTLTSDNVVSITVSQHNAVESFENKSGGQAVGRGDAKVVQDDGKTKTVEIIPLQVGSVSVEISVIFADGGMSTASYQLDVVPSSKGLKQFHLDLGFHTLPIVLDGKEEDGQRWLYPEVDYDQLDYPIHLTDSSQIKLTVEQPDDDPVIRLDSNGLVHGLHPGKAIITGEYDGVQDSVLVDVKEE